MKIQLKNNKKSTHSIGCSANMQQLRRFTRESLKIALQNFFKVFLRIFLRSDKLVLGRHWLYLGIIVRLDY